jgi:vacuolar-type H+-ATPase subunit H
MEGEPQSVTSASIEGIVRAAEDTAARIREEAEERARERIAEADRAVEQRVQVAEGEAQEILEVAHAQADGELEHARKETERLLGVARAHAQSESERMLASRLQEADDRAKEVRALARAEAREIVGEAHIVAREVVRDGTHLSQNLRELSSSLRNNAERLLRDVRLAHGSMTARLDQAGTRGSQRRRADDAADRRRTGASGRTPTDAGDELDVPEFMPRE